MRLVSTPIAALVVSIASSATAQLEESYTDKAPTVTAPALPTKAPTEPPTEPPAQPPKPKPLRPILTYDADKPIPPGYHLEEHPRDGLLIGGSAVTGIGAGLVVLGLATLHQDPEKANVGVVLGGAAASTGLILLAAWAALDPKKVVVRNSYTASLSPVVSKQTFGGSLAINF